MVVDMAREVISRRDAMARGMQKYYTGEKCHRGHLDFRYIKGGACVSCRSFEQREKDKKRNQLMAARAVVLKVPCHPDDRAAILEFAEMIMLARSLSPEPAEARPPKPLKPMHPDVAAAMAFQDARKDLPQRRFLPSVGFAKLIDGL